MSDDIPMWAKVRAVELANYKASIRYTVRDTVSGGFPALTAFARYIATHEQPPVDPLMVMAREAAARACKERGFSAEYIGRIESGAYDFQEEVQSALTALRMAKEQGLPE